LELLRKGRLDRNQLQMGPEEAFPNIKPGRGHRSSNQKRLLVYYHANLLHQA